MCPNFVRQFSSLKTAITEAISSANSSASGRTGVFARRIDCGLAGLLLERGLGNADLSSKNELRMNTHVAVRFRRNSNVFGAFVCNLAWPVPSPSPGRTIPSNCSLALSSRAEKSASIIFMLETRSVSKNPCPGAIQVRTPAAFGRPRITAWVVVCV